MTSGKLDFSSLRNALARLAEGYQRHLEMTAANPEAFDALPFADLIRTGNEQSLLKSDWSAWKIFREMRALANNALEDQAALEIVRIIPLFIEEIEFLKHQLGERTVSH